MRSLQLQADLAEMPRLAGWLAEQAAELGVAGRQLYAIELCLEEVVANLALHAQPSGPGPIAVTVRLETAPLRLVVEDDAIPFDPTLATGAPAAQTLEEAGVGGLGLGLVQSFAASREYGRHAGRNRLLLGFA
ncbi:MAG: ATP-binding protein [Roseococcus sp.]|nr:ATP-binding protein [Roseococcus sp.]